MRAFPYKPLGSKKAREAAARLRAGEPVATVAAELNRSPNALKELLRLRGLRTTLDTRPSKIHPTPARAPLAPRITTLPYDDPKAAIRAIERQRIAEEKA